ncbi:MAG: potassium channel family protein [Candidatus Anstonellales archaeon]
MDQTRQKIKIATLALALILLVGTLFYHFYEGFTWVDAFYLTAMTITTVGYGDIHPTHDLSKIFTVFLAFSGIGLVFYYLTLSANYYLEIVEKRFGIRKGEIRK